jgi:hypothetical protein
VRAAFCLALAFVVACGGVTTLPPLSPAPSASVAPSSAPTVTPATAATATVATAPVLRIALTDVRTGEHFTLGGLTGKTVIVEGMAVW